MPDETEAPFFYTNAVQVHMGAYDALFEFSYKQPGSNPRDPGESRCTVAMSLGHAKAMLPILAKLIAAYEQNVGPITAPGYEEHSKE